MGVLDELTGRIIVTARYLVEDLEGLLLLCEQGVVLLPRMLQGRDGCLEITLSLGLALERLNVCRVDDLLHSLQFLLERDYFFLERLDVVDAVVGSTL
jgi:hypothetical protein